MYIIVITVVSRTANSTTSLQILKGNLYSSPTAYQYNSIDTLEFGKITGR